MADVVPNLWYSDITNEVVDNNSTEEKEFVDKINSAIESAKELYWLECDKLAENCLENLNKEQLSVFLADNYFKWWVKSYVECRNSWQFLNFSMKAALQLLSKNDTNKYDNNWNPSENWRTIDDIIKERWGIDLDADSTIIKILQKKVGAHPDWKAGPQTIALVISALGGDVSNIYEWVNTLYANNENFRIKNIAEYTIWDVNYKYDKNQFTIWKEWDKVKITCNGDVKEVDTSKNPPVCEWFTFANWWIKKWTSATQPGENPDNLTNFEFLDGYNAELQNFVKRFSYRLDLWDNKTNYCDLLANLQSDWKKWKSLMSLFNLKDSFRKNWFKLDYNMLNLFNNEAWHKFGRWKRSFYIENDADEYCSLEWDRLMQYNNTNRSVEIFEVNQSHWIDDYRFDSVNAFFAWLWWKEITKERQLVKENSELDLSTFQDKFSDDVTSQLLSSFWSKWSDKYNTLISILSLPNKFWGEYKLNKHDIDLFLKWMDRGTFKMWLKKFHVEWAKFEVDGSHTRPRKDEKFSSVSEFFNWLEWRL